ncbi:MAG: hypothetical protein NZ699_03370 [Roseiflexus sp.]|nr:hypothetical protein [Roseiflexus sp.]MDW8145960.1 hypothetical protein [Roseiflexaceae bacterium]
MNPKSVTLLALVVLLFTATACTGPLPSGSPMVTPDVATIQKPTGSPLPTIPPTVIPTRAQPTAALATAKGTYLINQRATSTHSAFESVNLVIYRATLTDDRLTLRVGFHNVSDASFYIAGGLSARDMLLVDTAGNEYEPIAFSDNLKNTDPPGGFLPGQANVGDIAFPVPTGPAPYTLRCPTYEPMTFELNQPAPSAAQSIREGTYPLAVELYSRRSELVPIRLRLDSVTVTQKDVIFQVSFINTLRQGYDLKGVKGSDARLLDAEFAAYEPIRVSDNLTETIAPPKGWLPGQAHAGQITFPRPERMEEMRFIFPDYAAATLRFDASGLAGAAVTSAVGGAPPPTATPTVEQVALRELENLLERQAQAVTTGDLNAYLATFAEGLRQEQQTIFERRRNVPLSDYQVSVSPATSLWQPDVEKGLLRDIDVVIRYRLRGIPEDNPLQHRMRVTFERQNGGWVISKYELEKPLPFWWTGDVIVQETPHFLILARPDAGAILAKVAQECEQAYRDIQAAGLEPEARFVAYFTTTQDDFTAQTGMGSRTLGVALSLYELVGDQIQTLGRVFYINGKAFQDQPNDNGPFGRLATIRHELVHLALARETRPFTPIWLVEGAAMYYAGQLPPELRRRLVEDGRLDYLSLERLTGEESLGAYDFIGQSVGYEYLFSGETVRYLIETYGTDSFRAFYRYFSRVPPEKMIDQMPLFSIGFGSQFGKLSREVTPEALASVYGLTIADLDAAVKRWLREQKP